MKSIAFITYTLLPLYSLVADTALSNNLTN